MPRIAAILRGVVGNSGKLVSIPAKNPNRVHPYDENSSLVVKWILAVVVIVERIGPTACRRGRVEGGELTLEKARDLLTLCVEFEETAFRPHVADFVLSLCLKKEIVRLGPTTMKMKVKVKVVGATERRD